MVKAEKHKTVDGGAEYTTYINCPDALDELRCFASMLMALTAEIDKDPVFALLMTNSEQFTNILKDFTETATEAYDFFND